MKPLNRETASTSSNFPVRVLQFGTGNFLRGFADWVIDLLNEKSGFNGAIHLVQPNGKKPATSFIEQDGLYHVLINGYQNGKIIEQTRLITSITGVTNPYLEYEAFLRLAENPDLRFILSNTTEAGIAFDPNDKDPGQVPGSFPGKLTALLYQRYLHFNGDNAKGLLIIPCELIEDNGGQLKKTVLQYAQHWNLPDSFSSWIQESNDFCNTLVDRIVPGYPQDNAVKIQEETGFEDKLMVVAEPFHFWAIEGPENLEKEFPAEEIGLGVKFVKDLAPYRTRKVRILNGAHSSMVPVAYLNGFRTVRESIEDQSMGEFVLDTVQKEIIPTLDLPKEELNQFAQDVMDRFKNPFIHHQLISISLNSISKFKVRVLPSILEYVDRFQKLPQNLIKSFAALIVFYKGSYQGENIPLSDTEENLEFFRKTWGNPGTKNVVKTVLANSSLWGQDLNQIPGLSGEVEKEIELLLQNEE